MEFLSYDEPKRNIIANKFDKIIKNTKISRQIEQSIYNYTIKKCIKNDIERNWNNKLFMNIYLSKIRSIYSNLNSDSYINNKNLLKKVLNKEIDSKCIGDMSNIDLYPENWEKILEKKSKIDKMKYSHKKTSMSSSFKCSKCGGCQTSYYQIQTRSADEPMTQFRFCLDQFEVGCTHKWKD